MRATDTTAVSIQAKISGVLGVQIAGIPIEEDHVPNLPEDSDNAPANKKWRRGAEALGRHVHSKSSNQLPGSPSTRNDPFF